MRTRGFAFLAGFGLAAAGVGAARALTTSYVPVLLDRIKEAPGLIGAVMLVNALAGFAVPIAVGVWSDRRRRGSMGRRLPYVVGGVILSAGGLAAIALGTASSYLLLGLAATAVYVGLNAAATAHRAIVVESFEDARRPAATSAQEVAMLVGGMIALGAGAALIEVSAAALFAFGAVLILALAVPTTLLVRRRLVPGEAGAREGAAAAGEGAPSGEAGATGEAATRNDAPRAALRDLLAAARLPGAREVLLAQILWLVAYGALPAFFLLYADHALGVGPGPASALPAGFGIVTGVAMLAAGRARPERVYPLLLTGAALLGAGLVMAAAATTLAAAALPFAAAAAGLGLVTALGFPYFARFVPAGESGRYTGLFFSVRAIGSAVVLPGAGVLIALTGSYRVLPLLGAAALLSLLPLLRTARTPAREAATAPAATAPAATAVRVAAVVPCHLPDRLESVVAGLRPHVEDVVVVADGVPPGGDAVLARIAATERVELVRLPENAGKGDAVAAGAAHVRAREDRPDAIVIVDADGQHPPDRVPAFAAAAAAGADLVIGDRSAYRADMPRTRRLTNAISSALLALRLRRRVPDSQCGMRLISLDSLELVPFPPGRYEAETRHLTAAARAGLDIAWVPVPAIYEGAESSFRPLRDTARVLRALVAPSRKQRRPLHAPPRGFWRTWSIRLGIVVAGTMVIGALMPLLGPVDERLFVRVNSLGAGPDWLYEALDPHSRNYVLLGLFAAVGAAFMRARLILTVAFAVLVAGIFSDILVQAVYLLYDRPRPEEVLGSQALLATPERTWAHIASFPSGHLVVTTAIAVAGMAYVPALRAPIWTYVGLIALTRITFGAHYPLDVVVGAAFGYEVGMFSAWLPHALGMTSRKPVSPLPRLPVPRRTRTAPTGPA